MKIASWLWYILGWGLLSTGLISNQWSLCLAAGFAFVNFLIFMKINSER